MSEFLRTKWGLVTPTLRELIAICAEMRQDEIEQWVALVDPEPFDFERAANYCYSLPGVKFTVFGSQNNALVVGGFFPMQNGVMRSWMVGTQAAWDSHWRSITEASRFVMDCLIEDGNRRLETLALSSRTLTGKWYTKGLGMQVEGVMRQYGHGGEDVTIYSRLAPKTEDRPMAALEVSHGGR